MASKVLSDQGTADDLNSNALEIKIASGKVCLVSASNIAIFKTQMDGDRTFQAISFNCSKKEFD